jgi:hypothetical protein
MYSKLIRKIDGPKKDGRPTPIKNELAYNI